MFFTVIFDLHNLQQSGQLRSLAHPGSPLRWELLPDKSDHEATLLEIPDSAVLETTVDAADSSDKHSVNIEDADLASITNNLNKYKNCT